MSLRNAYKTNKTAETDGVDIPISVNDHNGEPITFKVSRMSVTNKRYTKALEEATRPHMASIQADAMNNELSRKIMIGVFVDSVLMGWTNVPKFDLTGKDEDKGQLLEFSKENAIKLFDELPDLFETLHGRASSLAIFRETQSTVNAGN